MKTTTPEQAVRHLEAQAVRHGGRHAGRRAEDRGMALAVHAGLQMVSDHGPDTVPASPQENSAECCADTSDFPRMPRRRPLLTEAGWFFVPYLIGICAIAAWAFHAWSSQ